MQTENIERFLANYSDEQLAALEAHTESGRLSYNSCCCLVGIPKSPHVLLGAGQFCDVDVMHLAAGRQLPFSEEAEEEFSTLCQGGLNNARGREHLLPLIRTEMERRETARLKDMSVTGDLARVG